MSGAGGSTARRWVFGIRALEGQIDRATLRTTLTYQAHARFSLGVEWNPLSNDVSPLANVLVWPESDRAPAIVAGTSSDRIGTPHGQSFYATASKNLKRETGLPIAPYAGVAYGTFEDRPRGIGGLAIGFSERLTLLVIFDGVHVHPTLTYAWDRHVVTFLLVEGWHPGLSYSIAF